MKKPVSSIIGIGLTVAILASSVHMGVSAKADKQDEKYQPLLSSEELISYWNNIDEDNIVCAVTPEQAIECAVNNSVSIGISLPESGSYHIVFDYKAKEQSIAENTAAVSLNEQEFTVPVYDLWQDITKDEETDSFGNELNPDQKTLGEYSLMYLTDYSSLDRSPIEFSMSSGENTLSVKAEALDFYIRAVYIVRPEKTVTYKEYLAQNTQKDTLLDGIITRQGEDYILKSDSYIRSGSTKNTDVYPNSISCKLLNELDGNGFDEYGKKVMWEFEVQESGYYHIAVKNNQAYSSGMSVFRRIEIDGELPFEELSEYEFLYTGSGNYENTVLGSDEPFKIWLDKGVHTLSLTNTSAAVQKISDRIEKIMLQISSMGIEIKKLTGNQTDKNRTWEILEYMPNVITDLEEIKKEILDIKKAVVDCYTEEPSFLSNLNYAVDNIEKILKTPKKIPSKLNLLSEGTGSVSQILGDIISTLSKAPLTVDCIYIAGTSAEIPEESAGFFEKILNSIQRFFYSFTKQARQNQYSDTSNKEDSVNIWMNRSVQYIQTLQAMIDEDFEPETGIKINLSIMPNEQKLILANAAGVNPDAAFGISHTIPYDLAIRKVAKNLLEYDDFLKWYSEEYNINSLAEMCYNDGVYGVSETQNFFVLFYRKDILNELGLKVPDTWEDVKQMMPVLHRYGMNFNLPASNVTGYKAFFATAPMIFQNNGELYTPDGIKTELESKNTIKGFGEFTDLYTIYSMAVSVPDFYNAFRYGTVPIGVSDFGAYLKIMYAAPEIRGLWDIALTPGTVNEDGEVERWQLSNLTSGMIFDNTDKPQETYAFMKWWMSEDTQLNYAMQMEQTFGPQFKWNTSNIKAFEKLNYSAEHKEIILEQWQWNREVFRHPAAYMLERELSMAYNDVVVNGDTVQEAMESADLISEREFERKLKEFGYIDEEGNLLAEYPIHTIEKLMETINEGEPK